MRPSRSCPLRSLALLTAAVASGGCPGESSSGSDAGGPPPDLAPPPLVCKTPSAPAAPWFTEVTATWLTAANGGAIALGNTVRAGDLDGDGYADLIVTASGAERDSDTVHTRFLYLNRPDPADPSGRARVFIDSTKASNLLATRDGMGGYAFGVANLGDLDNDGDLDVIVAPSGDVADPAGALLNDGLAHFTLAAPSELEDKVVGFGSASSSLVDFDRDGLLDWVPATFAYPPPNQNPPMVMKGAGDGRFFDVAEKWGINVVLGRWQDGKNFPSMYGVTACDIDMDGDQDILYADYGREPNFIYRNDGDHFTEIGKAIGVAYDDRMDYTDDQSYRCYCLNRTCDPAPPPPVDELYCPFRGWNPGYSDQPFRLGGNTFAIACGDLDDDGDMDLMTAEIRHGDVGSASDPSEILINDTAPGQPLGKFRRPGNKATGIDRPESGIAWDEGDMTPVFADLDLDGRKDIYLCSSDYPGDHGWLWRQKEDHTFVNVTRDSRIGQPEAHGIAFADFDHDGDLDVAIGTSTMRSETPNAKPLLRVYRNEIGAQSNFVQVELVGAGAGHTNRSAIGALVKVTAGGRTQMQEVSGGYGTTSTQNDLVLTFGLGATCTIDRVEVRWLDARNTVSTYTDVRANYRVRLREGSDRVEYVF